MSKKNNKSIKARAHNHDLERERKERERLKAQAAKNEAKTDRRSARAVASGGVEKKFKKKGFRIRKGVQIKGIKVTDSESKHKLLKLLKTEQARKLAAMDADGPGSADADSSKPKKSSSSGAKDKTMRDKAKKKSKSKLTGLKPKRAAGGGGGGEAAAAAMES